MQSFSTRVIKSGSEYWLRVPTANVSSIPKTGMLFVRVHKPEPPYTVFVPSMETKMRRFGKETGLSVPKVLVTSGVLRHKQEVAVAILANTV